MRTPLTDADFANLRSYALIETTRLTDESTAETEMLGGYVPAGFPGKDKAIRLEVDCLMYNNSGVVKTAIYRAYFGESGSIVSQTDSWATSGNLRRGKIVVIVCPNAGDDQSQYMTVYEESGGITPVGDGTVFNNSLQSWRVRVTAELNGGAPGVQYLTRTFGRISIFAT